MRCKVIVLVSGVALLLLTSAVSATSTITIDMPAAGATVSGAETSSLDLIGAVAFETPQPEERTFYVRRRDCDAGAHGPRLSIVEGPMSGTHSEANGCARYGSLTPLGEAGSDELPTATDYPTVDGIPFTLDASRPLTGVVTVISFCCGSGTPAVGAGLTTVDISVAAMVRDSEGTSVEHALGQTTVSYVATPEQQSYSNPWEITLPAALDKADVTRITLRLDVHGVNVLHGFTQSNTSTATVPIYTASFNRTVSVAVDDSEFDADDVTVSEDFTAWAATVDTPETGSHTVRARAKQGMDVSPVVSRTFTVVE